MSYNNANQVIQKFVSDYGNLDRNYAAIEYFMRTSRANTAIQLDDSQFVYEPGKKRAVRVNYWPVQCNVQGSCSTSLCDDGDAIAPKQIMFDIDKCTATRKWRLNEGDIRKLDNGQWDFSGTAQQMIRSAMPAARKLLATDMLTYAYTLAGRHIDGNTTKRITSVNTATGVVNPIGVLDIQKEYMDGSFMQPNVLGGGEIFYLKEMVRTGGLNNQGQQISQVKVDNLWYDDGLSDLILDDTANGNHILAIDPQVFKAVFFHENAGLFRTDYGDINDLPKLYKEGNGEGFILGSLRDPATGVVWDLYVNFTKCHPDTNRPAWTFQLKVWWDFFVMPDIACNVQGVNGIMHYRTCPPVMAACPSGDPVQSPATSRTYAWNPGSIFPFNAYQSNINGVENTQNAPVAITSRADLAAFMNDNYGSNMFSVSGNNIQYGGYSAIPGSINNGAVTFSFA